MATMVLPIRELSADVQLRAASVQKAFWDVAEKKTREVHFDIWLTYKTHSLNRSMAGLIAAQEGLLSSLQNFPVERLSADAVGKVAGDLERIVSMTNSYLDDVHQLPESCLGVWRPKLEAMADLSSHIDNYAESFRMAIDDACCAFLADIARNVVKQEAATH
jgi:hypothetical protein